MVDKLFVIWPGGVFKVKLDHFNVVSESINWKFNTLSDCYEVSWLWLAFVGLEDSKCLQIFLKGLIQLELFESEATGLLVEKYTCVEYCLAFFSSHLIEEKCLMRLQYSFQIIRLVLHLIHVLEVATYWASRANQGCQGVAHQEQGEMLFGIVHLVFLVLESI